ncbi:hypothetical protein KKG51_00410, partial [Patescibacteria group bacterium]|nr:hypothetical protein [Patescibacteria group bacterium]
GGFRIVENLKFDEKKRSFKGVVADKDGQQLRVEASGHGEGLKFQFTFLSSDLAGKNFSMQAPELVGEGTEAITGAAVEAAAKASARQIFAKHAAQLGGLGLAREELEKMEAEQLAQRAILPDKLKLGINVKTGVPKEKVAQGTGPERPGQMEMVDVPEDTKLREAPKFTRKKKAPAKARGQAQAPDQEQTQREAQQRAMEQKQRAIEQGLAQQTETQRRQEARKKKPSMAKRAVKIAVGGSLATGGLIGYITLLS